MPTTSSVELVSPRLVDLLGRGWTYLRLAVILWRLRRRHRGEDRTRARAALSRLLAEARGVAMKAGQLAAASADDADPMKSLVSGIEPRPLEEMRPVIEARLGSPIRSVFARIHEGALAASIGQVHRATLRDGTQVAVKVRYPGIQRALGAELALVRSLPPAGPMARFGFDRRGYGELFASILSREVDYLGEAVRQERFRASCRLSGVVVPVVVPELCRRGLLVQHFEPGAGIEEAATWESSDRGHLARRLLELVLHGTFELGLVHADPNPGNFGFRRGGPRPEVVLYDFGCVLELEKERRLALLRLLLELRMEVPSSAEEILPWLVAFGFDGEKLLPIAADLPALCGLLFKPFLVDRRFDLDRWALGQHLDELLGDLRWWFRSAGPPDSLLLVRIFQGLAVQLRRLDVDLPWWRVLERAVSTETREQALALDAPDLGPLRDRLRELETASGRGTARLLRLRVSKEGEETLALALPSVEVVDLETLLPEAARDRLSEAGIELDEVGRQAWSEGLVPGSLIDADLDGKRYQLWLE